MRIVSPISKKLSSKITDFFSEKQISLLATETGFIVRERNIQANEFVELLLFSKFDNSKLSLESLAEDFLINTGKNITKQAIDLKFTPKAVDFFKAIIEKALKEICENDISLEVLREFKTVKIKDSTCFQLPVEMADKYPGSGGSASKAMIRIQFEYNLKTGKIYDLSLHAFNEQDQKDSWETKTDIEPLDLIIRDLGYINLRVLKHISQTKAFYISRLISKVNVYELSENKYKEIDFSEVFDLMVKRKLKSIDKIVYLGSGKKKLKTRIIIEKMPEQQIEKRLQKANKEARKKGRTLSEKHKARLKLNIFITNIYQDSEIQLTSLEIHQIYTLRWQIELVFKIWKGIGEIHKVKKMKIERFESYLFAKLLWVIINWAIVWKINKYIYSNCNEKLLSFYKAFKSLKNRIKEFQISLKSEKLLTEFIDSQIRISCKYNLLERKKNCSSLYEIINKLKK